MNIQDKLDQYINEIFENLNFPDTPAGLYDPIRYSLASGGKRLRPILLLASTIAFGGDVETAVNQCIGIELFHNFTLLHDDVMDNSEVRRGQLTVHRRWNANTAILSGDTMLTLATMYMSKCNARLLPEVLRIFNKTAIEVYEGQQLDMDYEKEKHVEIEQYLEMIRLKTSVLLGCALQLGAVLAGASPSDVENIGKFGIDLGIGFQLRDDYLDTFGDPLIFGKNLGGDILNDKKTWLMITALNEDSDGKMQRIFSEAANEEEKVARVTALYKEFNLDKRILELISKYSNQALEHLSKVNITAEARNYFERLALTMADRTH